MVVMDVVCGHFNVCVVCNMALWALERVCGCDGCVVWAFQRVCGCNMALWAMERVWL